VSVARWKSGIAKVESGSSGGYSAYNPNTKALGKYQFVPRWWWKEIQKFAKNNGEDIKTHQDFLDNPEFQESFMDYVFENKHKPQMEKLKKDIPDSGLDDEELAALIHFKGYGDAKRWLKTGVDPTTKHNVAIDKYFKVFNKGRDEYKEDTPKEELFKDTGVEADRIKGESSPALKMSKDSAEMYADFSDMPFKEAFNEGRDKGMPYFYWEGRLYHTKTPEEVKADLMGSSPKEKEAELEPKPEPEAKPSKEAGVEDYLKKAPEPLGWYEPAPGDMLGGDLFSMIPRYPVPDIMDKEEPVKKSKVSEVLKKTSEPDYDKMSFDEAFKKKRAKGEKEFTWRGKPYTTRYKEEL